MSDGFFVRLENRVQSSNTLLCIGLDPHPSEVGTRYLHYITTISTIHIDHEFHHISGLYSLVGCQYASSSIRLLHQHY